MDMPPARLLRHRVAIPALLAATILFATQLLAPPAQAGDGAALPPPEGDIILRIGGDIRHTNANGEAHFDRAMLDGFSQRTLDTGTVVTDGVSRFEGFLMRDLLEAVGAEGDEVVATALNDYLVEIPMEDFHDYDVIVAHTQDGETLTPRDKGPLWIVYPRDDHDELDDIRYDYRWVWQLMHLEIR